MSEPENSRTRLVVEGWNASNLLFGALLLAAPFAFYLFIVRAMPGEAWPLWANLLVAVIALTLLPRLDLRSRISFDAGAGEARFEHLRLTGRRVERAELSPVSRVEVERVERTSGEAGKRAGRLVLVTGASRTPFTELHRSGDTPAEAARYNDWLAGAYGAQWREYASQIAEVSAGADEDEPPPEGIRRIRHPETGLTIDVPQDWSAAVSLDETGPLKLFGLTLIKRSTREGEKRPPGDGGPWNALLVTGAEDAGLHLAILDEPLAMTIQEAEADPWSRRFGPEVLAREPEVEIGGLRGFALTRRMEAGGTSAPFGKVSAPVSARQVWLGLGDRHLEAVGLARLDQPDMRRAVDAMIASIRLPS